MSNVCTRSVLFSVKNESKDVPTIADELKISISTVYKTLSNLEELALAEIDKSEKPTIVVFNKIDAYSPPENELEDPDGLSSLELLQKSWMAKLGAKKAIFISAQKKENMEELRGVLYEEVKEIFKVRYPYNNFLY